MNVKIFKASLLLMGASGIVAQIVLLRELLILFLGNELTIGLIFANWLLLEAFGSTFVGRLAERLKRRLEIYVFLQIFFSLFLPCSIFLTRVLKNILFATPGEGMGFIPIFSYSFIILFPISVTHGALFTFGCKLYSQLERRPATSIGQVYVYETIGSIVGGLLMTFFLIEYLHSFDIAFLISLLNTFISVFLIWPKGPSTFPIRYIFGGFCLLGTFVFFSLLFSSLSDKIHQSSIKLQWKGLNPVHYENSIYGNITVIQRDEQFTFFVDGVPSVTTPVPDIASIEDLVHFSMLFHGNPESVLILSGGAGGMIREILKYPVVRIDYVELDPLLLKLIIKFPTPITQTELADPRVKIHYMDGRFFIKKVKNRFDLIFIGLQAPKELQTNRLFSAEFFSMAQRKLKPGGLLVLTLPGSLTYISPELKELNGCLLKTLKSVFKYVRIIPGDVNLYLASDSEQVEKVTSFDLTKRFEQSGIKTSIFTPSYIEYRLHNWWLEWFLKSLGKEEFQVNSDFKPLGVYYYLSYWNSLFSPYLSKLFKGLERLNLKFTFGLLAALTALLAILSLKKIRISTYFLPYAIFTSGFTDMLLDLALVFSFQTFFGYLYHQIGLLITIFMLGIATGSYLIIRRLDRIQRGYRLFLITEIALILFAFLLPFLLTIPSAHLEKQAVDDLLYMSFLIMSFLCGALVGFQFPLATKLFLINQERENKVSSTAGLLYGADLFGGFLGGLFGGVLFLPILGLNESCFLMALVKITSFFLILLLTRIKK
ncbi:MAG: fused MFS/spermidine synthase [Candidatus Aminicenantes bacterium]|nr:fused MFS/spermidine synthase [Candidatus Aminicenantes bacterium]